MGLIGDLDRLTTRKPKDDFEIPFYRAGWFRLIVALVVYLLLFVLIYGILPHVIG